MTDSPGAALRHLLARTAGALGVAGGGTPLEARCAQAAGFESFYVSGYATAAWRHGLPDIGLIALGEVAAAVQAVTAVTPVPVIVDADTGYGDVAGVAVTVRRLEQVGAAAIQVEDQVWPKRCGHMEGTRVIPADEMTRKIATAVSSRRDADTIVIARTDAREPLGLGEAIDRGKRYVDAGADAVFVDAPRTVEELAAIARSIPGPLVVNMTESGRTPILPLAELGTMGFALVLFPTSALRLATATITSLFRELRTAGSSGVFAEGMATLDEVNALVGLPWFQQLETEGADGSRAVQARPVRVPSTS